MPGACKIRILLAEDNPVDVMLVEEALNEHSLECELIIIEDGEEALRFIDELEESVGAVSPALILMDLHLPKRNGDEILSRLGTGARSRRIPVIVMSGSESPSDLAIARKHKAHYFQKCADLTQFMELGAIVKQVLQEHRGERRVL